MATDDFNVWSSPVTTTQEIRQIVGCRWLYHAGRAALLRAWDIVRTQVGKKARRAARRTMK